MCDKRLSNKDKAVKDLEKSREKLKKTIEKGEDKLCQYFQKLIEKHTSNVVPTDGKNNHNYYD